MMPPYCPPKVVTTNIAMSPAKSFHSTTMSHVSSIDNQKMEQVLNEAYDEEGPLIAHKMPSRDPDNPMNWPMHRRIYTTAVSFAFAGTVAFGLTSYLPAIGAVQKEFGVSLTAAIVPFSVYLLGIAFAPLYTPHFSEKFGRASIYLISLPVFAAFTLGSALSPNYAAFVIFRFLSGFSGGPCLVLIEGTFADIWSVDATVTYYAVLTLASYIGAGAGPLACGFVAESGGLRWTQYLVLIVTAAAYLFGLGQSETYGRKILLRRAKRDGVVPRLCAAQSGVTLPQMIQTTVTVPLRMLVAEPIVILLALYLGFNFAIIFSFFISVPVVLHLTYNFTITQVGLAFIAAIGGASLAATTSILIDRLTNAFIPANYNGAVPIEHRLYSAMVGCFGITASLFWIAWTASPTVTYVSPILGTGLYVWGNASVLIACISYLFDAYPPRGTLAALTAVASFRLVLAAAMPLVIIQCIVGMTGAWAYTLFGFIAAVLMSVPFIIFKFGESFRRKSPYSVESAQERAERLAIEQQDAAAA